MVIYVKKIINRDGQIQKEKVYRISADFTFTLKQVRISGFRLIGLTKNIAYFKKHDFSWVKEYIVISKVPFE